MFNFLKRNKKEIPVYEFIKEKKEYSAFYRLSSGSSLEDWRIHADAVTKICNDTNTLFGTSLVVRSRYRVAEHPYWFIVALNRKEVAIFEEILRGEGHEVN